ncbi:ATP-binding protein [Natronosporangium hydrolyticum]|uniref:ATP-binding protein n=1 Tax=Natronosporangium hydrolyticum TaxID=2811111 RepID=A0A895YDJ5_9ACTN|nr:ATP-binding protein [Natronosporangium hydrolyticum]QSB13523.1 ATP-binding protein [Natronosporangium hydrolyticum]
MPTADYRSHVAGFFDSEVPKHSLGLVYGRRRIGKSTLLEGLAHDRGGFVWEATRTESAIQLTRLGEQLGSHLGVGRLALENWEEAFRQLLALGRDRSVPVVLDEFGHVLEADPSVDSIVAAALGPAGQRSNAGRSRLVLCGSAIAMMSALTAGEAPLRGRAGMELVMQPHDFRAAAEWLGSASAPDLAAGVYAVIGGVIGYATDMVDFDLPDSRADFTRWVAARVLSPAATLHHEATTLLAEDPTLAGASPVLHHGILGAIANGAVSAGKIAKKLGRSVSNLDPALRRLIAAGFVIRHTDPIRAQRPTYTLADPFLQFHYAVLEPHGPLLRERDPHEAWEERLSAVFGSRVRGPVFEEQARSWVRRYADPAVLGGFADHVGPSTAVVDGVERQLDVVVAADGAGALPSERSVLALGEAKAGETVGTGRLTELERARAALGGRAAHARLLLFAPAFTDELRAAAGRRADVELVDLARLYQGD